MRVIVGLGNPGPRYSRTRHNAGFFVLDELARRWGVSLKQSRQAASGRVAGRDVWLLKPLSFMNLSGGPVQALLTRQACQPRELLVVHDDVDLPLGKLRFKQGGGAGGQKGVKDIAARVGPDFLRLKLGVGRPPTGWQTDAWVLSRFSQSDAELLGQVVAAAADAVETLLDHGLEAAMNRTNGLDLAAPPAPPEAD